MPRKQLTRIATPETLAQIDPSFLAELLESHAEFLDRHGIKSGTRLEPASITRLSEVLLDPTHDAPASLIDALLHIDEMADEDGMQKLLEALDSRGIDLGLPPTPTPADVATRTWLRHPDIIERAHVEHRVWKAQSFGIFLRASGKATPEVRDLDERISALEEALRQHGINGRRGTACTLFQFRNGDLLTIAVRRGATFKRESCITNGEPSTVQYQPLKYEFIIIDLATWELRMTRGSKRDTDAYRRAVGQHLADDPEFFNAKQQKYDLSPITHDGRGCLMCNDIVGIASVDLLEIEVDYNDGISSRDIKKSADLFRAMDTQSFRLPPGARIIKARFAFTFDDAPSKKRTAEVSIWNRLRCTRSSDAELVNEFLLLRGFVVEAGHVALASA